MGTFEVAQMLPSFRGRLESTPDEGGDGVRQAPLDNMTGSPIGGGGRLISYVKCGFESRPVY